MPWSALGLAAHPQGRMHHINTASALSFKRSSGSIAFRFVTDDRL